eukprot:5477658-Lingulodinium_polyedra.AAC.1
MGLILAVSKGRARDYRFLMVVRRVQMIALAARIRISCRWIASECNPSDGPSRGRPAGAGALGQADA